MRTIKIDKNEVADIKVKNNKIKGQNAVADQIAGTDTQQKYCYQGINEELEQRKIVGHGLLAGHDEWTLDHTPYNTITDIQCRYVESRVFVL